MQFPNNDRDFNIHLNFNNYISIYIYIYIYFNFNYLNNIYFNIHVNFNNGPLATCIQIFDGLADGMELFPEHQCHGSGTEPVG